MSDNERPMWCCPACLDTGWKGGKASSLRSAHDPESACPDCGGDPEVHGRNARVIYDRINETKETDQ